MLETNYTMLLVGALIEVVNVLAIFYFLHTTGRYVTDEDGNYKWKNVALYTGLFCIAGLITTHLFSFQYGGSRININDALALLAGLIGGPITGTITGVTIGVDRFILDGVSSIPCSLTPIVSGILGGIIWHFSKKKFPSPTVATVAIIACLCVHIGFVFLMQLFMPTGLENMYGILFVLVYYNVSAMLIFSIVYVYKILPLPMRTRDKGAGQDNK